MKRLSYSSLILALLFLSVSPSNMHAASADSNAVPMPIIFETNMGQAPSRYGFAAGAGIEKRAKRIGIAPALRYTRWSEGQGYGGSPGSTLYNPNSVELMIGVSF